MATGLLHTHTLMVTLFLVHYLVKTILLVSNSPKLEGYAKKTKVPEMIISFLFLATGIGLWVMGPGNYPANFYIKLVLVFASIPLAVIGFKKSKKPLAILSILCLIGAMIYAYNIEGEKEDKAKADMIEYRESAGDVIDGQALYTKNCVVCHGEAGDAGIAGAKDLTTTMLSKEAQAHIIKNGKNSMYGFKDILTEEEIAAVVDYIETLKK